MTFTLQLTKDKQTEKSEKIFHPKKKQNTRLFFLKNDKASKNLRFQSTADPQEKLKLKKVHSLQDTLSFFHYKKKTTNRCLDCLVSKDVLLSSVYLKKTKTSRSFDRYLTVSNGFRIES